MTREEAKQELRSYRKQLAIMANRAYRVKEIKERMGCCKISKYGTYVGTSNPYYLEELIDRLNNLQNEHAEAIAKTETTVAQIMAKLEQLPSPYYEVLYDVFIDRKRYEQVAVNRHYSYGSIKQIVNKGIYIYKDIDNNGTDHCFEP